MIGHQPLVKMRRAGYVPASLWVIDDDWFPWDFDRLWPDRLKGLNHACIRIERSDTPETLDLRFAVGMRVLVEALRGDDRARRLHDAFACAKPSILVTWSPAEMRVFHG